MAEARSTPFDRINDALKSLDQQVQEARERFDEQVKKIETRIREQRERIEEQIRSTEAYKRADQLRSDVAEQVDDARSQILDLFGLASKTEIQKIHKKLNSISRKLNELSKEDKAA